MNAVYNSKWTGVDLATFLKSRGLQPDAIEVAFFGYDKKEELLREGTKLEPLIHGAGHELGRRAGTESTMLTAALGEACELARDLSGMAGIEALRDRLWTALQESFGDRVVLNGHPGERLPNTLNISFVGHVGNELLAQMPELAATTGSACHADRVEMSPVLQAMGVSPEIGTGAVRFSLGRPTTSEEIETVINRLIQLVDERG